jgi:hypothetical protein
MQSFKSKRNATEVHARNLIILERQGCAGDTRFFIKRNYVDDLGLHKTPAVSKVSLAGLMGFQPIVAQKVSHVPCNDVGRLAR